MKKNEFIKQLAEFCEFDSAQISVDTELRSIDGYDSLAIMSMIAFLHKNYNIKITSKQISELTDFNSLIDLLGSDNFDND